MSTVENLGRLALKVWINPIVSSHFVDPPLQMSHVNINFILCPASMDPFRGPYYRMAAILHQMLCLLFTGKVYSCLIKAVIPKEKQAWTARDVVWCHVMSCDVSQHHQTVPLLCVGETVLISNSCSISVCTIYKCVLLYYLCTPYTYMHNYNVKIKIVSYTALQRPMAKNPE